MQVIYVFLVALVIGFAKASPTDIINGFPVDNAPFYAQIWQWEKGTLNNGNEINQSGRVGGTLISDRHVIGRVISLQIGDVKPYKWEILMGCKGDHDCDLKINSNFSIAHYQYNKNTGENDIRIVYLPHPIIFTDRIQPAMLPVQSEVNPAQGTRGLMVGIRYNTLLGSYQTVMSDEECDNYSKVPRAKSFCTIDRVVGSSVCGYYGNGFIFKYKNQSYVAGLLSDDKFGCEPGVSPIRLTRISYYREWIKMLTGV